MNNVIQEVKIEANIHYLTSDHSGYIASYDGKEIKVDLFTCCDLFNLDEDDIYGKVSLVGFWDEDVFVAESFQLLC